MTLEEFAQLLRRQWVLVTAVTVAGLVLATVLGLLAGREYRASATLVLTPSAHPAPDAAARAAILASSSGMTTYAQLSTSPEVATAVVAQLGLDESPADLRKQLTATVPTNSYLIDLAVTADSPDHAVRIANAVAQQASGKVNALFSDRDAGFVVVVAIRADPATVAAPSGFRLVPIGLVAGLALGVALAIIREILDHRIRDDEDLRRALGVEPLARVVLSGPRDGRVELDQRAWPEPTVESVRRLRTTLRTRRHPPRIVLVTGVSGPEGGSSVAALLAQVGAAAGEKTLLVQCDLRQSAAHPRLGGPGQRGLADYLQGHAALADIVLDASVLARRGTPNAAGDDQRLASVLAVITPGTPDPSPGELLSGPRFREFLEAVAPYYDTIILDGAALLPYADSAALSTMADTSVLVAAVGRTPRRNVARATAQLTAVGTELAGVVLTTVDPRVRRERRPIPVVPHGIGGLG